MFLKEINLLSLVKAVMSTVAKSASGPIADGPVKAVWKFPRESLYSFLPSLKFPLSPASSEGSFTQDSERVCPHLPQLSFLT